MLQFGIAIFGIQLKIVRLIQILQDTEANLSRDGERLSGSFMLSEAIG